MVLRASILYQHSKYRDPITQLCLTMAFLRAWILCIVQMLDHHRHRIKWVLSPRQKKRPFFVLLEIVDKCISKRTKVNHFERLITTCNHLGSCPLVLPDEYVFTETFLFLRRSIRFCRSSLRSCFFLWWICLLLLLAMSANSHLGMNETKGFPWIG